MHGSFPSFQMAAAYAQLLRMPARFQQIRFGRTIVFGGHRWGGGSDIEVLPEVIVLSDD
jgi:hypothetical protein